MLPEKYSYLTNLAAPKIILEWLKIYGTKETPGKASTPEIMEWAAELKVSWYTDDSIPWCGLGMAIVAKRAGKEVVSNFLRALTWSEFGTPISEIDACLGDTLVFTRKGGGHVGTYVGESSKNFHVIGANQGDAVSITEISKARLYAVRRPVYSVGVPAEVKKYILNSSGVVSTNEA